MKTAIGFAGRTNGDFPYVNVARFRLKDGRTVEIDRDSTEWTVRGGRFRMDWLDCYFWGEGHCGADEPHYLTEEDCRALSGAKLVEIEIEEDADEGFFLTVEEFFV